MIKLFSHEWFGLRSAVRFSTPAPQIVALGMQWMAMSESSSSNVGNLGSRFKRLYERIKGIFPFALGMLATLLGMTLYNHFSPQEKLTERDVNKAIANAMASATPRAAFSEQVYRIIQPSLVLIEVDLKTADKQHDQALGTGVIVDAFGHILTSLHVVDGASKIIVIFADGTQAEAVVVLAQPENDTAVLQPGALPEVWMPAVLGNPNTMQVGDEAYVVGNPFGLYSSMSAGVISGFNRSFSPPEKDITLRGLIQFDAAANPGNSGGPLLDRNGYVMGIVTGIVNPTDESFFVGIGFAVPIGIAVGGIGSPPY
jgi:S1-C subfamily serine protease